MINSAANLHSISIPHPSTVIHSSTATDFCGPGICPQHQIKCPALMHLVPSAHTLTAMPAVINDQQITAEHVSNIQFVPLRHVTNGRAHKLVVHRHNPSQHLTSHAANFFPNRFTYSGQHQKSDIIHVGAPDFDQSHTQQQQIIHPQPPPPHNVLPPHPPMVASATFVTTVPQMTAMAHPNLLISPNRQHQFPIQHPPSSSLGPAAHKEVCAIVPSYHHQQQHLALVAAAPSRAFPPPSALVENVVAGAEGGAAAGDCWTTAVTGWEQAAMIKNKIGLVVNGRFRIQQSIASGSYGEIFAAEDLQSQATKKQRVAVKFDGACRDNHLRYEYLVYKSVLYEDANGKVEGFPKVYWYGHEFGHNIMVMDLLGAPVASLFAFCNRIFARQTIVSLGEQMIQRIRHLHQRGFIHRDIKPENFLMGLPPRKESTLYLIDFGLARRYRFREGENRTLTHIPFRRGRSFVGTAKYASLNSHRNIELSRRDDLESLAYVLIELINGQLPWKNISKRNATTRHQASQRIRQLKEQTNWEELCPCMAKFVRYCREIHFNDEPDYDKLLDLLQLIALPEFNNIQPSFPAAKIKGIENICSTFSNKLTKAAVCCQTPETAEKMTQVDFSKTLSDEIESKEGQQMQAEGKQDNLPKEKPLTSTGGNISTVAQPIHRPNPSTSTGNANVNSDFDELGGAATTTTSCSENELDANGCVSGDGVATRSGTGTADDEDSLPTPQQGNQQIQACRKCRRLRDQTHQQQQQHQQKRTKEKQQHHHHKQKQLQRVDTALQTDLGNEIISQFTRVNLAVPPPEQRKMCWQSARESNSERKFQYENRFSWTLPTHTDNHQVIIAQPPQGTITPAFGVLPPTFLPLLPLQPQLGGSLPLSIVQQQSVVNNKIQQHQHPAARVGLSFRGFEPIASYRHNTFSNDLIEEPQMLVHQQQQSNISAAASDERNNVGGTSKQRAPLQVAFVLPPPPPKQGKAVQK